MQCIRAIDLGCGDTCLPPRQGAQVILGATDLGIVTQSYCLKACAASDLSVGSACRELTFEERKAQLTGDGLGADRVETVVEEATGPVSTTAAPTPAPVPAPTPVPGALTDLLKATERAHSAAAYAR